MLLLPAFAQQKSVIDQQTGYRIEYERIINGNRRSAILYRRGAMFRQEERIGLGKQAETLVELYDAQLPPMIWWYSPKDKQANPTLDFILDTLGTMVAKEGEVSVKKRFSIPAHAVIDGNSSIQIRPSFSPHHIKDNDRILWTKQGEEMLLGMRCIRYSGKPDPKYKRKEQSSLVAWVEPNTGLILKSEVRMKESASSLAPPHITRYRVISIKPLSPSITRRFFQLPKGAVANVPEMFDKVKLPEGVKKRRPPYSDPTIVKTGMGFK